VGDEKKKKKKGNQQKYSNSASLLDVFTVEWRRGCDSDGSLGARNFGGSSQREEGKGETVGGVKPQIQPQGCDPVLNGNERGGAPGVKWGGK